MSRSPASPVRLRSSTPTRRAVPLEEPTSSSFFRWKLTVPATAEMRQAEVVQIADRPPALRSRFTYPKRCGPGERLEHRGVTARARCRAQPQGGSSRPAPAGSSFIEGAVGWTSIDERRRHSRHRSRHVNYLDRRAAVPNGRASRWAPGTRGLLGGRRPPEPPCRRQSTAAHRTRRRMHGPSTVLVEHLPAIVYTCEIGTDGNWLDVSPKMEEIWGGPRRVDGARGPGKASVHPTTSSGRPRDARRGRRRHRGPARHDRVPDVHEGRPLVRIRDESTVVHDEDGTPLCLQGVLMTSARQASSRGARLPWLLLEASVTRLSSTTPT
jgi:hypothetical protein